MTGSADGEAILRFSRVLENYLRKFHQGVLWKNAGKKGPNLEGPVIQFSHRNTQLWRLWWKVREDQMIMEFGRDDETGTSYVGIAERLTLPEDVVLERAEDHPKHSKTDYLILPTRRIDMTKDLMKQREVVDHAMRQALRLVALKPQIEKLLDDREKRPASLTS